MSCLEEAGELRKGTSLFVKEFNTGKASLVVYGAWTLWNSVSGAVSNKALLHGTD